MKRIIIVAVAALALAGCSKAPDSATNIGEGFSETTVLLEDGRTVTCILYQDFDAYGVQLSCDWAGAK